MQVTWLVSGNQSFKPGLRDHPQPGGLLVDIRNPFLFWKKLGSEAFTCKSRLSQSLTLIMGWHELGNAFGQSEVVHSLKYPVSLGISDSRFLNQSVCLKGSLSLTGGTKHVSGEHMCFCGGMQEVRAVGSIYCYILLLCYIMLYIYYCCCYICCYMAGSGSKAEAGATQEPSH